MRLALALSAGLLLAVATAHARVVEDQIDVPVEVSDAYGKLIRHTIKVTVFSDDTNPRPAPVMVLNHGRSAEPQGRVDLGRARFSDASRFFVKLGFIVAEPTRMGYGVTGGEDVEDTGSCETAKVPMLWVYTENDMYFGPVYPKEWYGAYVAGGAPAEFVQYPPHGDDGHALFTRFPDVWKAKVVEFLQTQGFVAPGPKTN